MSSRHDVEDAFYRYALAYDEDDLDALADCFTADALVWTTMNDDRAEGRPAIRALFEQRREARRARNEQVRHAITNVVVLEESTDELLALVYNTNLTTVRGEAPAAVVMTGWYRSRLVREGDGRLRVREHLIHLDAAGRTPAVPPR
jgi:ketosteroid isomerase-like protein